MGSGVTTVSQTIGFISFAFTLATAAGVFWSNLYVMPRINPAFVAKTFNSHTFANAPREIPDMLSNLKQSLYEERFHLRRLRRKRASRRKSGTYQRDLMNPVHLRSRGVGSEQSLQAMSVAIRHMISRFTKLESQFLSNSARKRDERRKSHQDDVWSGEDIEYELGESAEFYDTEYRPSSLADRWRWILTKRSVLSLMDGVQRIQMRRIAMQTTELAL